MKRKQFLQNIAVIGSGVLLMPAGLLSSCKKEVQSRIALTEKDIPLLDEIGETIIPTTKKSEGAKAAKIGSYILIMVNDCYSIEDQKSFLEGLDAVDKLSQAHFKAKFLNLEASQKMEVLQKLRTESKTTSKPYFSMLKDLTISGYFSSEIGATKARRYEQVPGRYDACVSYKIGDRAWTGVY